MKKISYKRILAIANDEERIAKVYNKHGFWRFARDSERHSSFLKKYIKKLR